MIKRIVIYFIIYAACFATISVLVSQNKQSSYSDTTIQSNSDEIKKDDKSSEETSSNRPYAAPPSQEISEETSSSGNLYDPSGYGSTAWRPYAAPPSREIKDYGLAEIAHAALATESTIGSFLNKVDVGQTIENWADLIMDGQPLEEFVSFTSPIFQWGTNGYNPVPKIRGTKYERQFMRFQNAQSDEDVRAIMRDIDREEEMREILSHSGRMASFHPIAIAAGMIEPIFLLVWGGPILFAIKKKPLFSRIVYTIAASFMGCIAGTLFQEAVLEATQYTRSSLEADMALSGGFLIGGLFGVVLAFIILAIEAKKMIKMTEWDKMRRHAQQGLRKILGPNDLND